MVLLFARFPQMAGVSVRGARWARKAKCNARLSTVTDRQIVKKAMAGLVYLREGEERLRKNVADRNIAVDVEELFKVYRRYAALSQQTDKLRHERNVSSRSIPAIQDVDLRVESIRKGSHLKQQISDAEAKKHAAVVELANLLLSVPNWTHPAVPTGDYSQARVLKTVGVQRDFPFQIKDHVQLGSDLGIIDFQSASKATGHSFYYLKGAAALLELAMVQYAVQKLTAKGFQLVVPPDVVREEVMEGCGFHPRGVNTQVYKLAYHHGDLCLSGTAEVPLAGMLMERCIPLEALPLRLVAFGRCFRAEDGGSGVASRGLYRVHQFTKVEMFGVTTNETGNESEELLHELLAIQEEIATDLGLHFKVLEMPTEELGTPAYHKYDLEAWMPGRQAFGEITSASNCTEFQSRRLSIMYPDHKKGGKSRKYTHTVNATALAIPRVLLAVMENYQNEDGSIDIPQVLQPFVGLQRIEESSDARLHW